MSQLDPPKNLTRNVLVGMFSGVLLASVIPHRDNEKDLIDVPKKVRDDIKIIPVENANEVIKMALTKESI